MPPKAKIAAPIDRPLSRAYLREFGGWSTAYPPGVSEPSTLRTMENLLVNKDGSVRVRPGLRYLTFEGDLALATGLQMVGTHEAYFGNDGRKMYLFAVREADGTVGFRIARYTADDVDGKPLQVYPVDHATYGFKIGEGESSMRFTAATTYVKFLQIDNRILALSDKGEDARMFWVGVHKHAKRIKNVTVPFSSSRPIAFHPNKAWYDDPVTGPLSTSLKTNSLQVATNTTSTDYYNLGFFWTFSNEFGESAASDIRAIKIRRRVGSWSWELPNADMEPGGTETEDANLAADQIVVMPSSTGVYDLAVSQGATHFNVYMLTWGPQDPVPSEGLLIGSKVMSEYDPGTGTWTTLPNGRRDCFVRMTPGTPLTGVTRPLPNNNNRYNATTPPRAGQGLVAADRLILVKDPASAGVVRWTSNQMGEYMDFTPAKGGGYKTLTSGNLYIPAAVKLWQNPQSADTITVLCSGVDGHSTAYYMMPAQVASQSDAVNIMGFEETTATPGTVSPYGVEVLNNVLYHPLENELMKSTASNYNINHSSMTDLIENVWSDLVHKDKLISSQMDTSLYYMVHNPHGAELEAGCNGNEIWVLDVGGKGNSVWSRFLVQAVSLRKIDVAGRLMMSVVRPEGIFCFDPSLGHDEVVDPDTRTVGTRPIEWKLETNTQGANRAHDAWAHLQQVNVTLGNFRGTLRYGVRGVDVNGKRINVSKLTQNKDVPAPGVRPYDIEDFLQIRKDMKEWHFYAESVKEEAEVRPSEGQISLVQYRYTPVSVNVGYEYGSVETFEYTRSSAGAGNNAVIIDGVPVEGIDRSRM